MNQTGLRVYLHTDLEGVAGVASFVDDTYPDGRFYPRARALLTEEVNAAVRGSLAAGADEIVVWDGHGPGGLEPERLHEEAKLVLGKGTPKNLLLDRGFSACLFVGQHAMAGTPGGNLAHSYSSRTIREMRLNGVPVGEFGIRSLLAGYFGVPVVFLSGDEAACREARALVPNIQTVVTKEGLTLNLALSLSPAKSRAQIEAGVRAALERRHDVAPLVPTPPFELTIAYTAPETIADEHRGWERVGETTVRKVADDFLEVAM